MSQRFLEVVQQVVWPSGLWGRQLPIQVKEERENCLIVHAVNGLLTYVS